MPDPANSLPVGVARIDCKAIPPWATPIWEGDVNAYEMNRGRARISGGLGQPEVYIEVLAPVPVKACYRVSVGMLASEIILGNLQRLVQGKPLI
jgi:hypothetical protein